MEFEVLSLFPEIFECYTKFGVIGRAVRREIVKLRVLNIRDFTYDKHRKVDDYPYGGGAGMVLEIEPIYNALNFLRKDSKERIVLLLTPEGNRFTQKRARELASLDRTVTLICGRYEGIDERVKALVDEEISIGDYVLSGGELAALVIIDTVVRLLPGTLGDERSPREDSFMDGLLDYPHYTRPEVFLDMRVPEVLLSGDHQKINLWRRKEALRRTFYRRPELLKNLSDIDFRLLKELCFEINQKILEGRDESTNH